MPAPPERTAQRGRPERLPREDERPPVRTASRAHRRAAEREAGDFEGADRPQPRLKKRKIKIDQDSERLYELVIEQEVWLRESTFTAPEGRLIFLDDEAWKGLALGQVRAGQGAAELYRVEVEVRARGKKRNAKARFIFLDSKGRPVEVAPPLSFKLLPHYTQTITIVSRERRAAAYIGLFAAD
jgi:hypothetical protein